jgi:hypothetical protein
MLYSLLSQLSKVKTLYIAVSPSRLDPNKGELTLAEPIHIDEVYQTYTVPFPITTDYII